MFLKNYSTECLFFMESSSAGKLWKDPNNYQRAVIERQYVAVRLHHP